MTRIRKNWSSSRGAEDPEPLPQVVVTHDSEMVDTDRKPPSPIVQLVDEDAIHMLAAVSLESLEHDSGIGNVKHENTSAKVMTAMSMNSQEHDDVVMHNLKPETIKHGTMYPKSWERPILQGGSLVSPRSKSDHWYQKLSALWRSDRGPVSLPNASTRREMVDEEQSKSSSVADNEMVDSDLSARVERAKQGLAAAEPMQGFISELLQVHCSEREPTNEETRVLQELVFGRATGRKRRQKPWESKLDLPVTVVDGYRTDEKTQKSVTSEGFGAGDSNKRRVKSLRVPQDEGTCDSIKIRAESGKVLSTDGDRSKPCTNSEEEVTDVGERNELKAKSEKAASNSDRNELKAKSEKAASNSDKNELKAKSEKVASYGDRNEHKAKSEKVASYVDRNELKGKSEKVADYADEKVVNGVDDRIQLNAKLEKTGSDVDDRRKQRAKSQDAGSDAGDRKKLRLKLQKVEGGAQKGVAEDIFPKGWKYKGLAQIAEKDEAAHGQVKKLCGRTDGHNWRCPLRVVEGLSLCQHHLNKARAKKMGKTSHLRKQQEKKKPEEASVSPHTSDSSTFKPSTPCDHVPTKFRRRHKTAKLSVL